MSTTELQVRCQQLQLLPIFSVMSDDGMNMMFVLVLLYLGGYERRMFCGFKSRCTIPFVVNALNAAATYTRTHTHTQQQQQSVSVCLIMLVFMSIVAVITRPRNCIWKMLKKWPKMFNNSAVYQYFRYCATELLLLLLNYHDDVLS